MKKLVRDKIPEKIESRWDNADFYIATESEYIKRLFDKLLEESKEVFDEQNNLEKLKEELWDLFEVYNTILKAKNISFDEVEKNRKTKKQKNWWFDKKYILNLNSLWKNK